MWRGVYCLTGQLWFVLVAIVDDDSLDTRVGMEAANRNPVTPAARGRGLRREVICIDKSVNL